MPPKAKDVAAKLEKKLKSLPLGTFTFRLHIFAFIAYFAGIYFSPMFCMIIPALLSLWQLTSFVVCWWTLRRPNYADVQSKYDTHASLWEENGVSILKPLHGVPERLEANLESFFQLKYPAFELILCIEEKTDDAVAVAKKLIEKYPNVDARISYGRCDWGINPKVNNMGTGYQIMKHNLFWIADANIVASDAVIQDMVEKMVLDARCGLVHQVPWMISGPTVDSRNSIGQQILANGSALDRWYFATAHSRPYLFINEVLCITCCNGMSTLLNRKALEEATPNRAGLAHFAQYIAEDAEFGVHLNAKGFTHKLCAHAAVQNLAETSVTNFLGRRVRWKRICYNLPSTAYAEPFEWLIETHFPSLIALIALAVRIGAPALLACIAFLVWWWLLDALTFALFDRSIGLPEMWQDTPENDLFFDWGKIAQRHGGMRRCCFNFFRHYVLWVVRELTSPLIMLRALSNPNQISWGGKTFQLRQGMQEAMVQQMKRRRSLSMQKAKAAQSSEHKD